MYIKLYDARGKYRADIQTASFAQDDKLGLLMVELLGAVSGRQAAWANLVKGRTRKEGVQDTEMVFVSGNREQRVQVVAGTKYHQVKEGPAKDRLLLMHQGFSRFEYRFLLGGSVDDPPPWFFQAMQQCLYFPTLPHWTETLWREAIDNDLISLASTCKVINVWVCPWNTYSWAKMVTRLIQNETLKGA